MYLFKSCLKLLDLLVCMATHTYKYKKNYFKVKTLVNLQHNNGMFCMVQAVFITCVVSLRLCFTYVEDKGPCLDEYLCYGKFTAINC